MSFLIARARWCTGPLRDCAGRRVDAPLLAARWVARSALLFGAVTARDARAQSAVIDTRSDTRPPASHAAPATEPAPAPAPAPAAPVRSLGVVTVFARPPTSLPTQIPATLESVTREQLEQTVNATDSEDALKYLPSAGAQTLYRRLQPRRAVEPRLGHRQQCAVDRVCGRRAAVQLPRQRRRWPELHAALEHGHARTNRTCRCHVCRRISHSDSHGQPLGLRAEAWSASDGATEFSPVSALSYPMRRERFASPKAALAYQAADDLVLKASVGRAVRLPTLSELYGATSTSNSQFINDPTLTPERSWTTELTAEKVLGEGLLRLTVFAEATRDALYSQTSFDAAANKNISRVQNVSRIETRGLELAFQGLDVGRKGLDLSASATHAHSHSAIKDKVGFVRVPGDTLGKRQPNIPAWRATALVSQRMENWTLAFGARYSGKQYRTLNNADLNGATYQGTSRYFTTDLRLRHQVHAPVVGGCRHRQPEQLSILEFSSVPAAQLQRRVAL